MQAAATSGGAVQRAVRSRPGDHRRAGLGMLRVPWAQLWPPGRARGAGCRARASSFEVLQEEVSRWAGEQWAEAELNVGPWVDGARPAPLAGVLAPASLADAALSRFADVGGVRVHYARWDPKSGARGADASTGIVLHHGFNGWAFQWRHVGQRLADATGMPVIAIDRPPFGLTQRPRRGTGEDEDDVSASGGGNGLAAVLSRGRTNPYCEMWAAEAGMRVAGEAEGFTSVVVCGHSAGAPVAMKAALLAADRGRRAPAPAFQCPEVRGVGLLSPAMQLQGSSFLSRAPLTAQLRFLYLRQVLETPGVNLHYVRRSVGRRSEGVKRGDGVPCWSAGGESLEEAIEGYLTPMRAEDWDLGFLNLLKSFQRNGDFPRAVLQAYDAAPILVLTGEFDRVVPAQSSVDLAALMPTAVPVVLKGVGHNPMEECPRELVGAMAGFADACRTVRAVQGG